MRQLNDFAARYLVHLLAVGAVAFAGFVVAQANANAAQDERLKAQEHRVQLQEHQFELFRRENREDHKQIQDRLDVLLSQKKP